MTLGPLSIDTEVAARANSVSTAIKDEEFAAGLRRASELTVTGAGATIRVPLDKSEVHEKKDEQRSVGLGPSHDWSSHAADAFGLMALSYEDPARLASFRAPIVFPKMGYA